MCTVINAAALWAVELLSDDGGLCSTQCILVLLSVTLHVSISFTLRVSTFLLCVEMCFTVCVCVCMCFIFQDGLFIPLVCTSSCGLVRVCVDVLGELNMHTYCTCMRV